jgi:DNA-binding PadR family transcriptional regulator
MRRKPGRLVPLEISICEAAVVLRRSGVDEFHGYLIAKQVGEAKDARLLTAYGTLYRALGRLEKMGLLESRWEDPEIPARENRPGRRLYHITAAGDVALADARRAQAASVRPRKSKERLAPA